MPAALPDSSASPLWAAPCRALTAGLLPLCAIAPWRTYHHCADRASICWHTFRFPLPVSTGKPPVLRALQNYLLPCMQRYRAPSTRGMRVGVQPDSAARAGAWAPPRSWCALDFTPLRCPTEATRTCFPALRACAFIRSVPGGADALCTPTSLPSTTRRLLRSTPPPGFLPWLYGGCGGEDGCVASHCLWFLKHPSGV